MEDTMTVDEATMFRYFTGESSEEEEKALLEWLEASEENRRRFFELKAVWNARSVFAESSDLASFAGFLRSANARIDSLEASRKRAFRLPRWTISAAASLLLVLTAGFAWRMFSTPEVFKVYENPTQEVVTVSLSDGTQVWLNARTTLTLREAFSKSARNVELSGAAFFDVEPDPAAPFIVKTKTLQVRVLGTAFAMRAYEDSAKAEVVLERGSVRLQTPEGVNLVKLHPDQSAVYDSKDNNLEITQVNASHVVLTQYDLVTMENATLHEILSRLETTYNVRLSIPGRYDDRRYTFNFQRSNSLEEVLRIVDYMTGQKCEVLYRQQ